MATTMQDRLSASALFSKGASPGNGRHLGMTKTSSNLTSSRSNSPARSSTPVIATAVAPTAKHVTFVHNTRVPFSKTPSEPGDDSIESSSSNEEQQHLPKTVEETNASAEFSDKSGPIDSLQSSSDSDNEREGNDLTRSSASLPFLSTQLPSATLEHYDGEDEEVENKKTPKKTAKKGSKKTKKPFTGRLPPKRKEGERRLTISERAGLQLPVGRVSSSVKLNLGKDVKLSLEAKIMLTAQLQLLLKDLTLISFEKKDEVEPDRKTITREDLNNAIKDSPLFSTIGEGLMIPTSDSGVVNLPLTKKMKKEESLFKKSATTTRGQIKPRKTSQKKKTPSKGAKQAKKTRGTNKAPRKTSKKVTEIEESISSEEEEEESSRDEESEATSSVDEIEEEEENVEAKTSKRKATPKPSASKRKRASNTNDDDNEERSRPKKKAKTSSKTKK